MKSKGLVQLPITMSFTTDAFSELVYNYSSWDALRIFLMSAAGGKLRVLTTENDDLAIIRYTKGVSDFNISHVPLFRSVVWNKVSNCPVSMAPVKALQGNPIADTPVRITDFVDGTMLHAFRTETGVRIATRTSLDARGTFYSSRSFADLFDDAFKMVGGTTALLESVLSVGEFVSFVLQHPEHKTVAPLAQPRVHVTYFGRIERNGTDIYMSSLPTEWPARLASYAPQVFEEEKSFADSKDAFHLMRSKSMALGFTWQGMVFQDTISSRRWRLRNSAYVAVRTLRGSEANSMERFVRLRAQGNMKKYLENFRDESNQMWAFEQTLRQRTQELYSAYNDMNKLKTKTMKQLPYCLRPHVYALHGIYLASLPKDGTRAANATPILKERVVSYVNDLPLDEQVKLLQGDRVAIAVAAVESFENLTVDGAHSPQLSANENVNVNEIDVLDI
jgi:hypothetical protein